MTEKYIPMEVMLSLLRMFKPITEKHIEMAMGSIIKVPEIFYERALKKYALPPATDIGQVFKAFSKPLEWRTIGGISRSTGFSAKSIEELIRQNASSFVTSSLSPAGRKLYAMTRKAWLAFSERERLAKEKAKTQEEASREEKEQLRKKQEQALSELAKLNTQQGAGAVSRKVSIIRFLRDSQCKMPSMSNIYLAEANLQDEVLENLDLENAVLAGANMSRANLSDCILKGANLSKAVLKNAKLTGAILSEANVSKADLSNSNLDRCVLSGAIIDGTNLQNASLFGSVLVSTDLTRTHGLTGFQLQMAEVDGTTIPPKNIPYY